VTRLFAAYEIVILFYFLDFFEAFAVDQHSESTVPVNCVECLSVLHIYYTLFGSSYWRKMESAK
jgi:hypothetical protein